MTGFESFLNRVTGIPREPTVVDAVQAVTLYRNSFQRKTRPGGFAELKAIRDKRMKPACRIVVTDERSIAEALRESGEAFPLLISGFADYDFSPVYGLNVLFLMPDTGLWAVDVAHQIADVEPKAFALQWPGNELEEVLWN
jgi:hypothetical protein